MAAHQQYRVRPPPAPHPLRLVSVAVPAPPLSRSRYRAHPPFASTRPLPPPPPKPPLPVPLKRAGHEAAAGLGVDDSAVVDDSAEAVAEEQRELVASVGTAAGLRTLLRAGPGGDPLFFLLTAVAVTTSVAFTGMVAVAIPTMLAMRRAANSFTMLADATLEELPSTMAAIRLSGMEISDLTLELSDLSHEIADGVNKSAKVAQAVEAGMGQMRDIAWQQTKLMIEERANLRTIPTGPDKKSHGSSSR